MIIIINYQYYYHYYYYRSSLLLSISNIIELQLDYNAAFPYNRRAYYNSFAIIKKKKQIRMSMFNARVSTVSPFEGIKILLCLSNLFRTNKQPEE